MTLIECKSKDLADCRSYYVIHSNIVILVNQKPLLKSGVCVEALSLDYTLLDT